MQSSCTNLRYVLDIRVHDQLLPAAVQLQHVPILDDIYGMVWAVATVGESVPSLSVVSDVLRPAPGKKTESPDAPARMLSSPPPTKGSLLQGPIACASMIPRAGGDDGPQSTTSAATAAYPYTYMHCARWFVSCRLQPVAYISTNRQPLPLWYQHLVPPPEPACPRATTQKGMNGTKCGAESSGVSPAEKLAAALPLGTVGRQSMHYGLWHSIPYRLSEAGHPLLASRGWGGGGAFATYTGYQEE